MEINWLAIESPRREPDWLGFSKSWETRCEYNESYTVFQGFFQKSEEGRLDGSSHSHFSHFSYELAPHLHVSKFLEIDHVSNSS